MCLWEETPKRRLENVHKRVKEFFHVYKSPLKFLPAGYTAGNVKSSKLIETDSTTMAEHQFFQVMLWSIACSVIYMQFFSSPPCLENSLCSVTNCLDPFCDVLHRSWQCHWKSPWFSVSPSMFWETCCQWDKF